MKPGLDSAIDAALERDIHGDDVVPDSLDVVRDKHIGNEVVVAMTFERRRHADQRRSCLGFAWSARDGWPTAGGAWASSVVDRPPRGIWLDWGGWGPGSGDGLHVRSGWLADPRAATLIVTDPLGRQVEDRVENGVAILMWRGDFSIQEATAELRDAAGEMLTREPLEPRRH